MSPAHPPAHPKGVQTRLGLFEVCFEDVPAQVTQIYPNVTPGCHVLDAAMMQTVVYIALGSASSNNAAAQMAYPLLQAAQVFVIASTTAACLALIFAVAACIPRAPRKPLASTAVTLCSFAWGFGAATAVLIGSLETYITSKIGAGLSISWVFCVAGGALALCAMVLMLLAARADRAAPLVTEGIEPDELPVRYRSGSLSPSKIVGLPPARDAPVVAHGPASHGVRVGGRPPPPHAGGGLAPMEIESEELAGVTVI